MSKLKSTIRTTQVNMGHRKIASELSEERLEKFLENGRNLRKSKTDPMTCTVHLNRVWRMSKEYIETVRVNREKMGDFLPKSIPPEILYPYHCHRDFYSGIIPTDGISKEGYVKEVWVEVFIESVEIDNQHYALIDPFIHDTRQWIQGFKLDSAEWLLPSPRIMVKYFRKTTCP